MGIAIIAGVTVAVFGAMCLAGLIAWFLAFVQDWKYAKEHCPVRLRFKQFQSFYAICPDRFDICHLWIRYEMRSHYRIVNISFSFVDTLKYLYWQYKREKDAKTKADVNKALEFLADMRANIYDFINSD